MAHKTIKGKSFTWHHFSKLAKKDVSYLQDNFTFHPLDFDDLREGAEIAKVDVYKKYIFSILHVPFFDSERNRLIKQHLAVFIGKNFIITAGKEQIPAMERFYRKINRGEKFKRETMNKSTGFFLYKVLDYIFLNAKDVLRELAEETHRLEDLVFEKQEEKTTRRLGALRNNVLALNHIVDPQRILIQHFINAKRNFLRKSLDVYFDDIRDRLNGMWVVTNNLRNIVDSLFSMNETLVSHHTNKIIRVLTVISVVLMPPTLITSYYGMNVQPLPFAHDIVSVSLIVIASLLVSIFAIFFIDKRR